MSAMGLGSAGPPPRWDNLVALSILTGAAVVAVAGPVDDIPLEFE